MMGAAVLTLGFSSCSSDFLDTVSTSALSEDQISKDPSGMQGILNGLHNMMYQYDWGDTGAHFFGAGHRSVGVQLDIMGGDMINTMPAYFMSVYRYQDHNNPYGDLNWRVWDMYYTIIAHANLLIDKAEANTSLPKDQKDNLLGQGYAFRAMSYHILIQCFGKRYVKGDANANLGVPLRLDKDNIKPQARATVAEVYKQIDSDMAKALEHLKNAPVIDSKNQISYVAALGLAARIDLCKSDWASAAKHAEEAINNATATNITLAKGKDLLDGCNNWANSEWIWAYKQASDQDNSYFSFYADYSYNFEGYNSGFRFAVNRDIYDKMDKTDVRRNWWVCVEKKETTIDGKKVVRLDTVPNIPKDAYSEYFPKNGKWEKTGQSIKFKSQANNNSMGDLLIMRLAELYYIKAEAEARMGEEVKARETLTKIMVTRQENFKTEASGQELIDQIMDNKRIDLWMEGQRFFDIKRLGIIINRAKASNITKHLTGDAQQTAIKRNTGDNVANVPTTVEDKNWQFAIPYDEIKVNPGLIKQNPL